MSLGYLLKDMKLVIGSNGLYSAPQKDYVSVLTPSTAEYDLIGDRIFTEVVRLKNEVIEVGPNPV